jgi:hypothetical protein
VKKDHALGRLLAKLDVPIVLTGAMVQLGLRFIGGLFDVFIDRIEELHDRNHHSRETKRSQAVPDGTFP